GPGEALVRVRAAGVCHRDVLDRKGAFPFLKPPIITGHELAGEVVALGEGVTEVAVHDRVTAVHRPPCGACEPCTRGDEIQCARSWKSYGMTMDGAYAEYVAAPVATLVRIPEALSYAEAAPLHCTAAVALHALRAVGDVRLGETVLLTGATGGVGQMALQLAL